MEQDYTTILQALEDGLTVTFVEECDCEEKYGRILHQNGGNYHRRLKMWKESASRYGLLTYSTFEADDPDVFIGGIADLKYVIHMWEHIPHSVVIQPLNEDWRIQEYASPLD